MEEGGWRESEKEVTKHGLSGSVGDRLPAVADFEGKGRGPPAKGQR